jgi:integrase/recombinase XerD
MVRRSIVTVYVRHRATCKQADNSFYRGCDCAKWLRYSGAVCFCGYTHKGNQHKVAADTRTWGLAEEKAHELQRRLDAGDSPTPAAVVARPTSGPPTIAAAIATFILGKRGEGVGASTIRKLEWQLGAFEQFMSERSKFFPSEITPTDVIEYRATWKSWSDLTQIKAQTNLRGLIRFCCGKENRDGVLAALKTIKETREGKIRREPKPFTEAEIKRLLAQVPRTFPDATKAARMTALIHLQISSGLAIRDAVQLERENIKDGWLEIRRQKTNKKVTQELEAGLHQELLNVTNGNPRYVFWNGRSLGHSATGMWLADLRTLMEDAGLWVKGNVSHRFRDTAVDFWLGAGASMNEIAALLGDKVAVVEKHYADLASKRMKDRIAKVPKRSW